MESGVVGDVSAGGGISEGGGAVSGVVVVVSGEVAGSFVVPGAVSFLPQAAISTMTPHRGTRNFTFMRCSGE